MKTAIFGKNQARFSAILAILFAVLFIYGFYSKSSGIGIDEQTNKKVKTGKQQESTKSIFKPDTNELLSADTDSIDAGNPASNLNPVKINVNTANIDELVKLSGIGKILAKRIVDYRNKNGSFKDETGLLKIQGIGKKKLERFKSLLEF